MGRRAVDPEIVAEWRRHMEAGKPADAIPSIYPAKTIRRKVREARAAEGLPTIYQHGGFRPYEGRGRRI
jgi:hypothetical protein